jgi:hypothetical protein
MTQQIERLGVSSVGMKSTGMGLMGTRWKWAAIVCWVFVICDMVCHILILMELF